MMAAHKLDLKTVLSAIDRGDRNFYNNLPEEDKKGYTALVLMRYMSSVLNQNPNKEYCLLATNDIVNVGFWSLSKHPELQHLLLCLSGVKEVQKYRPWISNKKPTNTKSIDDFLLEQNPECNDDELKILRDQFHSAAEFKEHLRNSGITDQRAKSLFDDFKKLLKADD